MRISDRSSDVCSSDLQADVRLVATGVIAQQEQHAQRRTIHVSGALQIDHITLRIHVLTLVSITEGLMRIEVEASADGYGQLLAIRRRLRGNGHVALLIRYVLKAACEQPSR